MVSAGLPDSLINSLKRNQHTLSISGFYLEQKSGELDSGFNSVNSLRPQSILTQLFRSPDPLFSRGQCLTNGPGPLWSQVFRDVLFSPVQLPQIFLLILLHDSQDTGDVFAEYPDFGQFRCSSAGHFRHSQIGQFLLQLVQLLHQLLLFLTPQILRLDLHFVDSGGGRGDQISSGQRVTGCEELSE